MRYSIPQLSCLVVWLLLSLSTAQANTKETLYPKALSLYQQKRYKEAIPVLTKLIAVLEKEQNKQKRGTLAWHGLTVGQCDVMERLAVAMWKQKQQLASCRTRQILEGKRSSLPKAWTQWNVDPTLAKRLQASRQHLTTACKQVPTTITFQLTPSNARLFIQQPNGKWLQQKGHQISTTQANPKVRIQAPGHQMREVTLTLKPWQPQRQTIALDKKLIVVVERPINTAPRITITRRNPVKPPKHRGTKLTRTPIPRKPSPATPVPVYKKWWFWTIIGVGVVGATATTIALTLPPKYTIRSRDSNAPLDVW